MIWGLRHRIKGLLTPELVSTRYIADHKLVWLEEGQGLRFSRRQMASKLSKPPAHIPRPKLQRRVHNMRHNQDSPLYPYQHWFGLNPITLRGY